MEVHQMVVARVTMTVSPSSFDCDDIGDQTVTLTVVDDCGLSSTATATVTVGAGGAPTITFDTAYRRAREHCGKQ